MTANPDSFQSALRPYRAPDIIRAIPGIPRSTVYAWTDGDREPPAWLRPIILDWLKRTCPATPTPE